MRKLIVIIILIKIISGGMEKCSAAGTTGADFLRIDNSIISSAIGGASTSRKLGVESVFINPANFYDISHNEVYFMHFQGFGNNKYTNFLYAGNLFASTKIGAGIIYSYINDVYADYSGFSEQNIEFTNSDFAVQLSLSRKIIEQLSGGLSLKYFKQTLGSGIPLAGFPYTASAISTDAGLLFNIKEFDIGAVYKNILIGNKPKFKVEKFDLPEYLKIGISRKLFSTVILSADYQKEKEEKPKYSAGIDFIFRNNIRFLTGYKYNPGNESADGFTFGFKFDNVSWTAGYSYTPFENADGEHRIGASYKWGVNLYNSGNLNSEALSSASINIPHFYITNNISVSYQYNEIDNKNISYYIPSGNSNLTLFTMANSDRTDIFFRLKTNSDKWAGTYVDNFLIEIRNKESNNDIQIGDITGFSITDYSFNSKNFRGLKLEKKIILEKPLKKQDKLISLINSLNHRELSNPGRIISGEIIDNEKQPFEFDLKFFAGYTEQGINIGDKYRKQNQRVAVNNIYEQQVYGINTCANWNYFLKTSHSLIFFKDNENSIILNDEFVKPLKNTIYQNSLSFSKNKYNLDFELTFSNYDNDLFSDANDIKNDFASLLSFWKQDKIEYNFKIEHIGSDFNSAGNYNYLYDNDKNKIFAEIGIPLYNQENKQDNSKSKAVKFKLKLDANRDNLKDYKDYTSVMININPEINYIFGSNEINFQYQSSRNYSDNAADTTSFIRKINTLFYLYNLYYTSNFIFNEETNKNLNFNAGFMYSYFDNNSEYLQIQEYLDYDRTGINASINYNNIVPELNLNFYASYNKTNYFSNQAFGDTVLSTNIMDYSLTLNYSMMSNKIRPYFTISRQFNDAEQQDYYQKKIKAGINIVLTDRLNLITEYENDKVSYSPAVTSLDYSNYKYYAKINYIFGFDK